MVISDRIFERLRECGMTQKEFAEATGIAQSSISDWKRKGTNPSADNILIICKVLNMTPEELLSGIENADRRSRPKEYLLVDKNTELGKFVLEVQRMDEKLRERLMGYYRALTDRQE